MLPGPPGGSAGRLSHEGLAASSRMSRSTGRKPNSNSVLAWRRRDCSAGSSTPWTGLIASHSSPWSGLMLKYRSRAMLTATTGCQVLNEYLIHSPALPSPSLTRVSEAFVKCFVVMPLQRESDAFHGVWVYGLGGRCHMVGVGHLPQADR